MTERKDKKMKQCTITFEQDGRKAVVVVTEDYKVKTTFTPPMDKEHPQAKDILCLDFLRMLKND